MFARSQLNCDQSMSIATENAMTTVHIAALSALFAARKKNDFKKM